MTGVKRTLYGRARRLAYDLWRGPDYVEKPDEHAPSGGPCLLRLAIRTGITAKPLIEARAIYGSLTEQDAILRAVYWDSQTVLQGGLQEDQQIKVPVRFVQVPIGQVQQWISSFNHLQTALHVAPRQDDSLPICSLRIEVDAVYSLFEKVWQVLPGELGELERTWQDVWQQMGQALQTHPTLTGVEESFPCVQGKTDAYDFQTYTPSLNVS